MTTEFKLNGDNINIYQMEHYITHMLSELNSRRNDGWVEEHYKKELTACSKVIDNYINNLKEDHDDTKDWVKDYERNKLTNLLMMISSSVKVN